MQQGVLSVSGVKGDEALVIMITMRAVAVLILRSQTEKWLVISDWNLFLLACCMLLQVLAIYNIPWRKSETLSVYNVFRPGVDCGTFCVSLVPVAVLTEVLQQDNPKNLSELSFLLAAGCVMLMMAPYQLKRVYGILYLALVLAASFVLMIFQLHGGSDSIPLVIALVVVACSVYCLPIMCTWSFTFGEACVVSHIIGAVVFRMARWMVSYALHEVSSEFTNESYMNIFISVLLVFLALACTLVLYWNWCYNIIPFLLVHIACALMAVGVLLFLTDHQPITWLFWFIFGDARRYFSLQFTGLFKTSQANMETKITNTEVSLLVWWSFAALFTGVCLVLHTRHLSRSQSYGGSKGSMAARKMFHCIVVAVFLPGLVVDPHFLYLASVVAFAVLVVLEVSRVIGVEWLGPAIDGSFRVFVDERDQGPVFLTHFYLLSGMSMPLWLTHHIAGGKVRNFSGLISLGIGDTVACVFGMQFGRRKWPGTKKSLEGTLAAIFTQLLFVMVVFYLGWLETVAWINITFAVVTTSVFEALVSQIDNLVLPLFMLACLS